MRVTLGMTNDNIKANLTGATSRLLEAQDQASSGKRIDRPSDDVAGIGKSLSLRSTISSIEQYEENSTMANSQLSTVSNTLSSITKTLQSVRSLASQAANSTLNDEALASIKCQLEGISDELKGYANTQYLNKYIFAGSKTTTSPVAETGGTPAYEYQGNNEQIKVQTAPGAYTTVNVTGDLVFNMGGAAVSDAPDIFTMMDSLISAVDSGDISSISAQLADIDANLNNITGINTQVGARIKRLESNIEALGTSKDTMKSMLSDVEDVDLAEAAINLATLQNCYEVALSVASSVLKTSLADFLS
ncbi:MAG: flagellar hook-associated protein FlgL [Armatimonadota bacterium]